MESVAAVKKKSKRKGIQNGEPSHQCLAANGNCLKRVEKFFLTNCDINVKCPDIKHLFCSCQLNIFWVAPNRRKGRKVKLGENNAEKTPALPTRKRRSHELYS